MQFTVAVSRSRETGAPFKTSYMLYGAAQVRMKAQTASQRDEGRQTCTLAIMARYCAGAVITKFCS